MKKFKILIVLMLILNISTFSFADYETRKAEADRAFDELKSQRSYVARDIAVVQLNYLKLLTEINQERLELDKQIVEKFCK